MNILPRKPRHFIIQIQPNQAIELLTEGVFVDGFDAPGFQQGIQRAFGDLYGVGLEFAQQAADLVGVAQAVDQAFCLIVERDDERLHMGFDHAELCRDGLEGEVEAAACVVVHGEDSALVQLGAFELVDFAKVAGHGFGRQ